MGIRGSLRRADLRGLSGLIAALRVRGGHGRGGVRVVLMARWVGQIRVGVVFVMVYGGFVDMIMLYKVYGG